MKVLAVSSPHGSDASSSLAAIHAPLDVDGVRDRFQMIGVYARAMEAEMIEFHAFWHRTHQPLIGHYMDVLCALARRTKLTVTELVCRAAPVPTRFSDLHLLPEALLDGQRNRRAATSGRSVTAQAKHMAITEPSRFRRVGALIDRASAERQVASVPAAVMRRAQTSAERALVAIDKATLLEHRGYLLGVMRAAVFSGAPAFIVSGGRR